jgi:AraC-like DNA-binding protein
MPPQFLSTILSGYIDVAHFVGTDPYPILHGAHIDPRWLRDDTILLPADGVVQVLEESARQSGRDDFGILMAETRTFASLGPVALLVEHEHSAREILNACMEFRPTFAEPLSISIEEHGELASVVLEISAPYGTPQLTSHVVAVALAVLTDALEGTWRPLAAHFRHAAPKWVRTYAGLFRCPLEFNSSFDGLLSERATLDAVSPSAQKNLARYARRLLNLSPEMSASETCESDVRRAIYLLLRNGQPTLRQVAATLNISTRSLQRRLAQEDATFADVLTQTRRDLATRYLAHSVQPITEIAHMTGYSNLSSFARWFRQQFRTSPLKWRQKRRQQQAE